MNQLSTRYGSVLLLYIVSSHGNENFVSFQLRLRMRNERMMILWGEKIHLIYAWLTYQQQYTYTTDNILTTAQQCRIIQMIIIIIFDGISRIFYIHIYVIRYVRSHLFFFLKSFGISHFERSIWVGAMSSSFPLFPVFPCPYLWALLMIWFI